MERKRGQAGERKGRRKREEGSDKVFGGLKEGKGGGEEAVDEVGTKR